MPKKTISASASETTEFPGKSEQVQILAKKAPAEKKQTVKKTTARKDNTPKTIRASNTTSATTKRTGSAKAVASEQPEEKSEKVPQRRGRKPKTMAPSAPAADTAAAQTTDATQKETSSVTEPVQKKKLLFVGSEALPFAASGGLGDVLGSLPGAIAAASDAFDVRVVMPLYSAISWEYRKDFQMVCEFTVPLAWRMQYCGVWKTTYQNVTYYFLDNEYYFKRSSLYGSYDDGERFAYFCMAVMEMLPKIGFFPDLMHLNDWQSAACAVYLKHRYAYQAAYRNIRTIYTIHNIEYQGIYDLSILGDLFGLGNDAIPTVEYGGCINLTKAAILCADRVSTVSARYAGEIQNPYFAHGLAPILQENAYKLSGIVNGIDVAYYDPMDASALAAPYNAFHQEGKAQCKAALQEELHLPIRADVPIIAMVSRLASHKGFDLIRCVFSEMLNWEVQFVLLGTGEAALQSFFAEAAARRPDRFAAVFAFDKALSKRIYAGADLFLMPSKSEPCGLSQMIASRYGAVPIVREVGGLADTIHPYSPATRTGNGVTFVSYNAHDMKDAVGRAVGLWYGEHRIPLRTNAMQMDFSWRASANTYLSLYRSLLG